MDGVFRISGEADQAPPDWHFAGGKWLTSVAPRWIEALATKPRFVLVDLSNVTFISLPAVTALAAMIERIASLSSTTRVEIDLKPPNEVLRYDRRNYLTEKSRWKSIKEGPHDLQVAHRMYRLVGFMEALGLHHVLNVASRSDKVHYVNFMDRVEALRGFATRTDGTMTIVNPLMRIETKESCSQFIDAEHIRVWRTAMGEEFIDSPIFDSDELWRIFCHELSANIFEHAGSPGFVAARVVKIRNLVEDGWDVTYRNEVRRLFPMMRDGFVELSVSDAGHGFAETLAPTYKKRVEHTNGDLPPWRVLAFAFDEFGTRKDRQDSWLTDRHALGRLLQIVAKYGGAIGLRSSGAEVLYATSGGPFTRLSGHLGYRPLHSWRRPQELGAHIHLILPLYPVGRARTEDWRSKLFQLTLPEGFVTNSSHPKGHLVPLAVYFTVPGTGQPITSAREFSACCRRLVADLSARADQETIVLDFGQLNWTAGQLETFLRLLENTVQQRPVLLVELPRRATEELKQLEFLGAPSLAAPPGEMPTERVMEAFSGVHSILLGVDQDDKRYLFGVRDPLIEQLLLQLIVTPAIEKQLIDEITRATGKGQDELRRQLQQVLETSPRIVANDGDTWKVSGTIEALRDLAGNVTDRDLAACVLQLEEGPATITQLFDRLTHHRIRLLHAILNHVNRLFFVDNSGAWRCAWDAGTLEVQCRRAMNRHFDEVARRCRAWRGRVEPSLLTTDELIAPDPPGMKFNLPWQREWVTEFFESARILSRQRYADEIAQRLIFRLRHGLRLLNSDMEKVEVLACATAPAILLATALHRWWPTAKRPAIADLGHYVMMCAGGELPSIETKETGSGVVVIQDIMDRGIISRKLIRLLRSKPRDVLCVLGLAALEDPLSEATMGFTDPSDGWKAGTNDEANAGGRFLPIDGVPVHAMIRMPRPPRCPEPKHDYALAQWVEPRTLRPFNYPYLRRELQPKETTRERIRPFFSPQQDGIVCAGHYVYAERHYTIALDIRRALDGAIGAEVAEWIADVCSNTTGKSRPWENSRAHAFHGDVTAVLMPLHSQIHYLWPRVEMLLAQRGRRQPVWLLDATIFLGEGPSYRLPLQFSEQIRSTAKTLLANRKANSPTSRLRILILDDAIVSSRTAETVLAAIVREVEKATEDDSGMLHIDIAPVEWIRYFALFNQMPEAKHRHWANLKCIDSQIGQAVPARRLSAQRANSISIDFLFDEYRSVCGIPLHDEQDCPACADMKRLKQLENEASFRSAQSARTWANEFANNLSPIALDGPGFRRAEPVRLPRAINVKADNAIESEQSEYQLHFADEAILRFYELAYFSYPPGDLLRVLVHESSWPENNETSVGEYERFRWAVFEWALRHWPRLEADCAFDAFFVAATKELSANTCLVERIFAGLARHYAHSDVQKFIKQAMEQLAELEASLDSSADAEQGSRCVRLDCALNVFFLGMPKPEREPDRAAGRDAAGVYHEVLSQIVYRSPQQPSLLRNLLLGITRPRRLESAVWPLQVVAETIFRGRDPRKPGVFRHKTMPRLLDEVGRRPTPENRILLHGALGQFLAALDDLNAFSAGPALATGDIKTLAPPVIDWLTGKTSSVGDVELSMAQLGDALDPEEGFCRSFDAIFHGNVASLGSSLRSHFAEILRDNPEFVFAFEPDPEVQDWHLLVSNIRLQSFLTNWGMDRAKQLRRRCKSRITAVAHRPRYSSPQVRLRIVTNFAPLDETRHDTGRGRNYDVEIDGLRTYGVELSRDWMPPTAGERSEEFTAGFDLFVPTGMISRNTSI